MGSDLGLTGLGILVGMSLLFGAIAQFVGRAGTRWDWLIGALAFFVGGLFLSEVMFAGVTEEEVQLVIDGLAFDEALAGGLLVGIAVMVIWRFITGGFPFKQHAPA